MSSEIETKQELRKRDLSPSITVRLGNALRNVKENFDDVTWRFDLKVADWAEHLLDQACHPDNASLSERRFCIIPGVSFLVGLKNVVFGVFGAVRHGVPAVTSRVSTAFRTTLSALRQLGKPKKDTEERPRNRGRSLLLEKSINQIKTGVAQILIPGLFVEFAKGLGLRTLMVIQEKRNSI